MKLIRYKKSYEKIAMGLLSYMPGERPAKKLQEMIQCYETDDHWQLFLLKQEEDIIGLIGIEVGETSYTVQHISVNPSFRGEGIGNEMVSQVQTFYRELACKSTEETESFLKKCQDKEEGTA